MSVLKWNEIRVDFAEIRVENARNSQRRTETSNAFRSFFQGACISVKQETHVAMLGQILQTEHSVVRLEDNITE
jgi:hypothetical protein